MASYTYQIPDENLETFKARFDKIVRRAAKLNVQPPSYAMGEALDIELTDEPGHFVRHWPVTVTGAAPRLDGWTFGATLSRIKLDDGTETALIVGVPGHDFSNYRTAESRCDHCRTLRWRKETYILVHEDGRKIQVGSTCIDDFFGGECPYRIAAIAELFFDAIALGEDSEGGGGGGGFQKLIGTESFVADCCLLIRDRGFISRKKAREEGHTATADLACGLKRNRADRKADERPTAEDIAAAKEALAWAADLHQSGEELNDYLYAINVVARRSALDARCFGLAASIPTAYLRHLGKLAEKRAREQTAATSQWIGKEGERGVYTLTLLSIHELESAYGTTRIYAWTDADGNRFKWFASSQFTIYNPETKLDVPVLPGATLPIVGRVKKHTEYKGVKETVLTRCNLHTPPVKKARAKKSKETTA